METALAMDSDITHVAIVHCETTWACWIQLKRLPNWQGNSTTKPSFLMRCRVLAVFYGYCWLRHRLHDRLCKQVHSRCTGVRLCYCKAIRTGKVQRPSSLIKHLTCLTSGTAWKATMVNGASPLRLIQCALSTKLYTWDWSKKVASRLVIIATKPTKPHWLQVCVLLALNHCSMMTFTHYHYLFSILQLIAITNSKNSMTVWRARICDLSEQV